MKVPEPRKLPSGTYFIQLRLNGVSVPVTASTPTACKHKAELIKAEHRAGKRKIQRSEDGPTLRAAIDVHINKRKLSPSTVDGYRRIQKNHFQAVMDEPITNKHDWQAICNDEGKYYAAKTVKNAYSFIKTILRENGITPQEVTISGRKSTPREWLEPDEIKELIAAADGTPSALPVFLALHSLRRSEIAALSWEHIDLKKKTITVEGAVVQDEKHHFARRDENKTEKSTRTIPIMIPELLLILASTPQEARHGVLLNCNPHTIAARINAACRRAGLTEVGTHGLRHSFASLAYHLRLTELETMDIGGWADIGTMHKIYTHLAAADRLKAENKISDFFANKNANDIQKT